HITVALIRHSCYHPPLLTPLFFFNHPATTEIYTLSLHDALPICDGVLGSDGENLARQSDVEIAILESSECVGDRFVGEGRGKERSEEHTSELQSLAYLVCRLLLEKKKKKRNSNTYAARDRR